MYVCMILSLLSLLSKDSFVLGKLHKDIAMHLMECVEDATMNDQKVIKACRVCCDINIIVFVVIGTIT